MHYYGAFFMGVSELSSMPLAFVDMFKQFPHLMKEYPAFADHVRTTFGVLFLIVRVVLWFPATYSFWHRLARRVARGRRRRRSGSSRGSCICNLFLSFLQLFWATLILSRCTRAGPCAAPQEGVPQLSEREWGACEGRRRRPDLLARFRAYLTVPPQQRRLPARAQRRVEREGGHLV